MQRKGFIAPIRLHCCREWRSHLGQSGGREAQSPGGNQIAWRIFSSSNYYLFYPSHQFQKETILEVQETKKKKSKKRNKSVSEDGDVWQHGMRKYPLSRTNRCYKKRIILGPNAEWKERITAKCQHFAGASVAEVLHCTQ